MAQTEKETESKIKIKKKLWHSILAPKLFGQQELGETYLAFPDSSLGRVMKINLKDLTGNVKDQNAYINFKINKVEGNMLRTTTIGYELTPTYVKKLVRKNTNRLDDHFILKLKDNQEVIVKSLIITQYKAQHSVQKQLRTELKKKLEKELKETDFSTFISDLIARKIHFAAKKSLHKIFPVKEIAIRSVKLKYDVEKEAKKTEEAAAEDKTEKNAEVQKEK